MWPPSRHLLPFASAVLASHPSLAVHATLGNVSLAAHAVSHNAIAQVGSEHAPTVYDLRLDSDNKLAVSITYETTCECTTFADVYKPASLHIGSAVAPVRTHSVGRFSAKLLSDVRLSNISEGAGAKAEPYSSVCGCLCALGMPAWRRRRSDATRVQTSETCPGNTELHARSVTYLIEFRVPARTLHRLASPANRRSFRFVQLVATFLSHNSKRALKLRFPAGDQVYRVVLAHKNSLVTIPARIRASLRPDNHRPPAERARCKVCFEPLRSSAEECLTAAARRGDIAAFSRCACPFHRDCVEQQMILDNPRARNRCPSCAEAVCVSDQQSEYAQHTNLASIAPQRLTTWEDIVEACR